MILIIDDDSAVRSSLSFMLKRAGYEAQVVPGPRETVEQRCPAATYRDGLGTFHCS